MDNSSTSDNVKNEPNPITNVVDSTLQKFDFETASNNNNNEKTTTYEKTTDISSTSNTNANNNESEKKELISSHYKLRKRRSAYLQSDSSSDNESEEFGGKLKDINLTSTNYTTCDRLSTNSMPTTNPVILDDVSLYGSADINYYNNLQSSITESLINRSLSSSVGSSIPILLRNFDATSNSNASISCNNNLLDSVGLCDGNSEVRLRDFVEKHPNEQLKPVEYPSILRMFAMQYNTFPARIIDSRFAPVSYEHNDNVKPDYKLISPFVYYYQEFTSFELSFYYQMLILFLHSKICRVPQICMNRLCVGYQAIVLHLKQCLLFKCKNVYCYSARLVLHHIATCAKTRCQFCVTLPAGAVEYCKNLVYSNDQTSLKLLAILKNCFSAPCITAKNEEYNVGPTRKILNLILNDYLCIEKSSYADKNNKVLASVDRSKVVSDIVKSVDMKKIDVTNINDSLLLECENFEKTLYRHSHNKDIYLQSVTNICLMFQFFSQIMIQTNMSPLEELKQILSQIGVCGMSVKLASFQSYGTGAAPTSIPALSTTKVDQLQNEVTLSRPNNTSRDLSYGYENMFKFTPTQICSPKKISDLFLPLLQDMYNSPDGIAFQSPVDPVYYMIYDYYDLITYPMDLHTIITRLKEKFYVDPWEVIHDVWQTIKNAWLYNRRTTRVYKLASRLKDTFLEKVDPIIKALGMCCAQRRVLTPQPLFCMGKDYCVIHREAVYYIYQNYYIYCERCFTAIAGDTVTIVVDEDDDNSTLVTQTTTSSTTKFEGQQLLTTAGVPNENLEPKASSVNSGPPSKTRIIDKTAFLRETNSKIYMEKFVECRKCSRRVHQICKQHTTEIDGIYYYCEDCLEKMMPPIPRYNHYTCERLIETNLSSFIEQRLNEMLVSKLGQQIQPVRIRQVYNNLKKIKTSTVINEYFVDKYPSEFMYHSKALFAFQKLNDGSEICFFGMHVQEFDSESPEPNRGRAYLSYLDSVHFFQPKNLKTQVYFTILTAYFEYVRRRGFSYVHLWACPPCEGDDYIFHCHPAEQRVPKHKRLVDWYRKLLDECVKSKIFTKIKDLHKYIVSEKKSQLTLIPYFEGDYWPNAFEDIINEVKAEKNPEGAVCSGVSSAASSFRRGRAMLMQDYDKEDTEEETANNDDDDLTGQSQTSIVESTDNSKVDGISERSSVIISSNKQTSKSTKKKRSSKCSQRQKRSKPIHQKKRNEATVPEFLSVEQRLFNLLERFKDVFFVCRLNNSSYSSSGMAVQKELDPSIHCDLTDGRSGFLQLCRERKWEFSTMLRTKFTTLGFLVELHIQFGDRFIFTCNNCKCHLFRKYHCTVCSDFDLCYKCFYVYGHEHQMVEVDESNNSNTLNLASFNQASLLSNQTMHQLQLQKEYQARLSASSSCGSVGGCINSNNSSLNVPNNIGPNFARATNSISSSIPHPSSQQTNILVAQELLDIMLHCSTCPVESIYDPCPTNDKCQRMRIAIQHCSECNNPNRLKCPICYSLMTLCIPHARGCRIPNCRVVFCKQIRERICFQSSDNNNRPRYHPRNHVVSKVDTQRRMAQMHQTNYMQTDTTLASSVTPFKDIKSSTGNMYYPNAPIVNSKNVPNAVDISNFQDKNFHSSQTDPNMFQPTPNLQFRSAFTSSFPNNPTIQPMIPPVNTNVNDSSATIRLGDYNISSVRFNSGQNVPNTSQYHSTIAIPTNTSDKHLYVESSSQPNQQPLEITNNTPSTGDCPNGGAYFHPLKSVISTGSAMYGEDERLASMTSFANTSLSLSRNLTAKPAVLKPHPSNVVYLKEVPLMIDPHSNPSIPIEDILTHNLGRIERLLESNEVSEKNIMQVASYVKLFPYVMCHLSDNHQNLVISYLKNKKSMIALDEKEDSLITFLHRIQASKIIKKIQIQHQIYQNNVNTISQLAQQQNNHVLKSLWAMPKQQIINFVNNFGVVNDPQQKSQSAILGNDIKTEVADVRPTNLIQNSQQIEDRFSNTNYINSGIVAPSNVTADGQTNLSTLCYMASNSNNHISGPNLAHYIKTLLINNHKNLPSTSLIEAFSCDNDDNNGNRTMSQHCAQNDYFKNARGGSQHENIPLIGGSCIANAKSRGVSANSVVNAESDVNSPLKLHSANDTNLPHLAMFSCDAQKNIRADSCLASNHSSSISY